MIVTGAPALPHSRSMNPDETESEVEIEVAAEPQVEVVAEVAAEPAAPEPPPPFVATHEHVLDGTDILPVILQADGTFIDEQGASYTRKQFEEMGGALRRFIG